MTDGLSETSSVVRFGAFELDAGAGELRQSGAKVPLSGKPFYMLTLLLQARGGVVTREELHQKLWSPDVSMDFDRDVTAAIDAVRDALGDDARNPRFVETLPQGGYRFTGLHDPSRIGASPSSGSSPTVRVSTKDLFDNTAPLEFRTGTLNQATDLPIAALQEPSPAPPTAPPSNSGEITAPLKTPPMLRSVGEDSTSPIAAMPSAAPAAATALQDTTTPITGIVIPRPAPAPPQPVSSLRASLIVVLLAAVALIAWLLTRP